MTKFVYKTLGAILKERGLVSEAQLQEGLAHRSSGGQHLGRCLIALGHITEEDLLQALGIQANMEMVDLDRHEISPDVRRRVPGSIARLYSIMPLSFEDDTLTVATADPLNLSVLDDLRFMFNCAIRGKAATLAGITKAISAYYGDEADTVEEIFSEIREQTPDLPDEPGSVEDIAGLAGQLPIIRLLNLILLQAIRRRASDIHFEPFQDEFKIRYRLDGVLYDVITPPQALHLAIASRIKVMANLNIAETRLPQDGRTFVKISGRVIDLRVSTLPTIFGESVVIRILDKATVQLSLDDLGMEVETRQQLRAIIQRPYGILLSTGPTGCGKTTTQYSCLNEINRIQSKIITVEDPVEFDVPGLIQVSVQPKINLTFPVVLRHILRQDPDIIMVGEIRDAETVQMAIHASLTGHLVFSTLHTNDAPSAITRLVDMDVEPFLIASSLEAVLAQRLVRTLCQSCRTSYPLAAAGEERVSRDHPAPLPGEPRLSWGRGSGCDACQRTGFSGRIGVYELLVLNEELRSLILDRAPVAILREAALRHGMRGLRDDGLRKVLAGKTTVEELDAGASGNG